MSSKVLRINRKDYTGWKSVRMERSIDTLAGVFEATVTDVGEFIKSDWAIKMGDLCTILEDGVIIFTGFIEDFNITYDKATHDVTIKGRDKVADLVDCSFVGSVNEWQNLSLLDIVKRLCAPFDITVEAIGGAATKAAKIEEWMAVEPGDTVYNMINKLCQKRAILPTTYGEGKLLLVETGIDRASTRIESGVNILSAGLVQSDRERFSEYITKGQGLGSDTKGTTDFAHPKGDASDSVVTRYRPLTLLSESAIDFGGCDQRAKWEASRRAGGSRSYTCKVQGWTESEGVPWRINKLVQVKDNRFDMNESMLLYAVSHSYDNSGGTTTDLMLTSPEKYKADAELAKITTGFDFLS